MENKEIRKLKIEDKNLQTRAITSESGSTQIIGYAALFNHPSKPLIAWIDGEPREYIETINPSAFTTCDFTETTYNIDHDNEFLIARVEAGNLKLEINERGLMFIVNPPSTTVAKDLQINIEVGNYFENSFAFYQSASNWSIVDGQYFREIMKIDKVTDVSTVICGAYSETSVANVDGQRKYNTGLKPETKELELDELHFDQLIIK